MIWIYFCRKSYFLEKDHSRNCWKSYENLFRFRYRFRPKQKYIFGFGIGFGRNEKWLFRWVSVSAEIEKSLSVVHYSKLMYYARKKRHTGYIAKKNQAIPLQNVHSVKKFEYLYPNVQWTIALLLAWKGIDFPFFPSYSFFWVVNFKYCHSVF